ncbi:MAG: PrgI family protein [Parcubacteria group bacterium]|nr:PrgI family protein [Parcubacteria group bacterium]
MAPQFVVPQFIDVEDKIIGPITTRQFIIGIVAILLVFAAYKLADTALFALEAVLILGAYALIAFIKINGQPFYRFALSIVRSAVRSQLRVWSKQYVAPARPKEQGALGEVEALPAYKPRMRSRALSELTLLVDTGGKYRPEEILAQSRENQNKHAKE